MATIQGAAFNQVNTVDVVHDNSSPKFSWYYKFLQKASIFHELNVAELKYRETTYSQLYFHEWEFSCRIHEI